MEKVCAILTSMEPEVQTCSDLKDVTGLTMIWDGLDGVNIQTALNEEFPNVNRGDIITFRAESDVGSRAMTLKSTLAVR